MIGKQRLQQAIATTLLGVLAMSSAGCGAMFGSKQRTVTITSMPAGAEAIVDGQPVGYTPVVVSLANNRAHEVLFRHGQSQSVCRIDTEVDATWLILDILAFPIGVVVDGITGDWKELEKSHCHTVLPGGAPPPGFAPPPGPPPYQGYPPQNVAPPAAPTQGYAPQARQ